MQDFKLIQEIHNIIRDIEDELNSLDKTTRKGLCNAVYFLGNNFNVIDSDIPSISDYYYAFIIKKSFWKNNLSVELYSSLDISANPGELSKVKFRTDDYKFYKLKKELSIFDTESLVKIKRFLLSFAE